MKGTDDVEEWKATKHAMDVMNFTPKEQHEIDRIVAGILHLGNIKFETSFGEGSAISNKVENNYNSL